LFNEIPEKIKKRMDYLEAVDKKDRVDGTPRMSRLRQVPPETGKFIALMLSMSPEGIAIEIGTSAGYSALWLALACREKDRKLYTFEKAKEKIKLAQETFLEADVTDVAELVQGDALENLKKFDRVSFCFLDAEKEIYGDCYETVIPRMARGGVLVADNAINHYATLKPFIDRVLKDERVDAMVVPIEKGELVCRKK
jgi:predicted O-methyltransferase YrrM